MTKEDNPIREGLDGGVTPVEQAEKGFDPNEEGAKEQLSAESESKFPKWKEGLNAGDPPIASSPPMGKTVEMAGTCKVRSKLEQNTPAPPVQPEPEGNPFIELMDKVTIALTRVVGMDGRPVEGSVSFEDINQLVAYGRHAVKTLNERDVQVQVFNGFVNVMVTLFTERRDHWLKQQGEGHLQAAFILKEIRHIFKSLLAGEL